MAPVLLVAEETNGDAPNGHTLPKPLAVVPAAVRAQQLALALATLRGVDPDNPPGLANVTPTV
jgi:hypothetical protein